MNETMFPEGFRVERLSRTHPRQDFRCGAPTVDEWLATKALQNQSKRLSATYVLVDIRDQIAGYYTLAMSYIDFGDLPKDLTHRLPRRLLPTIVLAWFGIAASRQKQGLGKSLFSKALFDCWQVGQILPFVAVILDCLDDYAKLFYQQWNFRELPGHPSRLFFSAADLNALIEQ